MKNPGNRYPWQGMLVLLFLGISGLFFLFITGFYNISTFDELYKYIYEAGLVAIVSIFFIVISIYAYIMYFINVIIKPKKAILYLYRIKDGVSIFLDIKGNKYLFYDDKFQKNKFYYVMKTHNDIHKVLNESYENFKVPKEKKSYWLNCYLPMGNFENIFLLPIIYIILLPGILSFIMSKGYFKIFGLIWSYIPLYLIFYDFIYKIKLKQNNYKSVDEKAFKASYIALLATLRISAILIVNIVLFYLLVKSDGIIGKIIISLFCLCALCGLGHAIADIFNNEKATKLFYKGYIAIFLLYVFGVIVAFITEIIIEEKYLMLLFTVPFWTVWIYILYKFFIRKK